MGILVWDFKKSEANCSCCEKGMNIKTRIAPICSHIKEKITLIGFVCQSCYNLLPSNKLKRLACNRKHIIDFVEKETGKLFSTMEEAQDYLLKFCRSKRIEEHINKGRG